MPQTKELEPAIESIALLIMLPQQMEHMFNWTEMVMTDGGLCHFVTLAIASLVHTSP
jgi:hypothetical protein